MPETLPTQTRLLMTAYDICHREPVICLNERATTVRWTNTTECSPGIGVEVDLNKPIIDSQAQITRADFFVFETRGDAVLVVRESDDIELFEDDYAKWIAEMFDQYDHTKALTFSGLVKIANLRSTAKPRIIAAPQFQAADPVADSLRFTD